MLVLGRSHQLLPDTMLLTRPRDRRRRADSMGTYCRDASTGLLRTPLLPHMADLGLWEVADYAVGVTLACRTFATSYAPCIRMDCRDRYLMEPAYVHGRKE